MKYSYKITLELPVKQSIVVKYSPDCETCTPDEVLVRISPLIFDIENEGDRAAAIHELILSSAPIDTWKNQKKEHEDSKVERKFSLAGLDLIGAEGDTETTAILSRDPRKTIRDDWSDGMNLARREFKRKRGTMSSEEVGQHLRKFVEDQEIELAPKRAT